MPVQSQSWEDAQVARLKLAYPGWDIWYVRHAAVRQTEWCARPAGAPVAVFHAWTSGELVAKLDRAIAS